MLFRLKISILLVFAFITFGIANSRSRILNGDIVPDGKYPFMVSVHFIDQMGWNIRHWCGGTILNEDWVLTAATCTSEMFGFDQYRVYAGSVKLDSVGDFHNITEIIRHANYTHIPTLDYYINNIAILKVDPPFDLTDSDRLATVSLPESGYESQEGEEAIIMGWGGNVDEGYLQNNLLEAIVPTLSDGSCADVMSHPQLMMCAADPEAISAPCDWDSGGPLLVNNVQLGILETSKMCSFLSTDNVDIYTQVSAHVHWINSRINN